MILGIIINFSIMFTFTVFSYFILQTLQEKNLFPIDLKPFFVGMMATIISILLMKTAVAFDDGLILDNRNISILFAGLIGGPYALLLASVLVGIFRIFFMDVSTVSLISGLNIIFIGIVMFFFAYRKNITFKNIQFFLFFQTIEVAVVLFFLDSTIAGAFKFSAIYITSNLISFYTTFYVIKLLYRQFERIRTIQHLADTDYVTDLANNRKFHEVLKQAFSTENSFSVLLIDIDQFKTLNRRYGHAYGDEILFELAKRIKTFTADTSTFAARASGEEFYLLCYDAPPAIGIHQATDFALMIRNQPFVLSNGIEVSVTVSIGVSTYPDNGHSIRSIESAANSAVVAAGLKGTTKVMHANQLDL